MADESSIIINIHAQSDIDEATKQVAEMLQAARDLAANSGKLQQANNTLSSSFQQEAGAANKSVQALRDVTKQENMLEKASASMRTELRKVNDQLRELAMQGDTSSETFLLLADRAAQMTDTMGDTQAIINILASDTKNLDTAIGVGAGLTGAFSAATSAAALLGGESEALNEAFLKVQAAMSIINGIQQVAAVMDQRSAANVVLRTALTKLFVKEKQKEAAVTGATAASSGADAVAKTAQAGATAAATTATKGFTAALLANPVMLIVAGVAALAAGLVALTRHFENAAVAARGYEGALNGLKRTNDLISKETNFAARMAEAEGKGWREVLNIQMDGAQARMDAAEKTIAEMKKRQEDSGKELTDAEKGKLDEAIAMHAKALEDFFALYDEYDIKQTAERRKAEEDRLAQQEEYAKKRREAAEAEAKKRKEAAEAEAKLIEEISKAEAERAENAYRESLDDEGKDLLDLDKKQQKELDILNAAYDKKLLSQEEYDKRRLEIEERYLLAEQAVHEKYAAEEDDVINPDTYRDAMALKMQLEGASEDEIYQYRYNSMRKYLQEKMALEQEGTQAWMELNNELTELEIENAERVKEAQESKYQQAMEIAQQALQFVSDMTNEVFGAMSEQISAQLDNLHEMYTTDAAEAAKDEKKKYITKEEFDRKEAALKIKQAKLNKAAALFSIGLNTAMSIMSIWADPTAVWAMKIALTAMAATLGAAQLAAAAAKPLPQYAKGRKGGKGEYAMVGERGAEIMYVPDGASIIPHNKINDPSSWGAFGVPSISMPAMPYTDRDLMMTMAVMQATGQIDYDRMGAALAKHMPQQKAVSVNIDRNGIMVSNGHDTHTYLNAKYSCAW